MFYGGMPMMIFILAAGYLFTVYLLLGLAKRTGKRPSINNKSVVDTNNIQQKLSVSPTVTEVVNSQ
ncbi:hypothetical protein NOS3756_52900 [Nostoc sp. NIES-3756]|uniref:hypothetical protein n=1 Tax=Nostoc sp. NIES-3756 TaxID=1751286 RepID=UPI00071F818E|nr:hypothetical protein NOS3756_52900 [Nostoc sp. NIES-3756]BAY35944.1 hypothetical protein NIES2111_02630 [Nostoc sp. NIES-2111]